MVLVKLGKAVESEERHAEETDASLLHGTFVFEGVGNSVGEVQSHCLS